METFTNIAQDWYGFSLLTGIALLLFGGHLLVEGSVAIAKRLGVGTLVIGLTIVAFSTSSPELAFNIISSLNNHGDLSLGNIFGSNIANIGLVLGIGALICKLPVTGQVVKMEFPLLVVATIIVGVVCYFQGLSMIGACVLLLMFCLLMWKWFTLGKRESVIGVEAEDITPEVQCSSFASWAMLLGGLVMLGLGGKATELGAVSAALSFGMSEILVGGSIVAIATSLPELVTTVIAARKGHPDLAVGNVVGSNIFNILFVLPISVLVAPGMTIAVPSSALAYIFIMVVMTVIAWILTRSDKLVKPKEGALLVGLFIIYLVYISIWKSGG
ncbi:MAG TPA: calcium/sodium antiporter [Phycisphaerales bacterium]|nr:calcium/sodium antiporter [Phycisphaerales bacterium]